MIWSKEETLPRSEIEKIQLERLKETVFRVYEKVPAYRAKMDAVGVKPEDINDQTMIVVAREIAEKIESELEYPGQIKVNVVRETRAVEYAK